MEVGVQKAVVVVVGVGKVGGVCFPFTAALPTLMNPLMSKLCWEGEGRWGKQKGWGVRREE